MTLQEIYNSLPTIECRGLCSEACGPIICTDLERSNVEKVSHRKLSFRKTKPHSCTLLKNNRCLAYEQRPLVCRLFGLVPSMRCQFGCEPTKWLTDAEGHALLQQAEEISEASGR